MKSPVLRFAKQGIFAAVAAALFSFAGPLSAADLKLMVEPQYNPEKAAQVYKPFVDYINKATGHKLVLLTPRNYHFFWRDVRQNAEIDFVFEEAHFTDYHVKHFQFEPLVRAAEKTSYTLLSSDQLKSASLDALVGKSIVTMPSPSLGFAILIQFFPNPVAQPNILSNSASWRDGVETVAAGEADAAIVPTWLKNEYPNFSAIKTSQSFPGVALSASPKVDPKVKQDIKVALLKMHEDANAFSALTELGISKFEETSAAEYDGQQKMLKGFYGFQ